MGIIHGSGHEYAWASIFSPPSFSSSSLLFSFSVKTRDKPATNPFDYSLEFILAMGLIA